jgi:energy-coupling factor transporter ATP-binding protein EcfA2
VIAGRATGVLLPPPMQVFAADATPVSALAIAGGLFALLLGLLSLRPGRVDRPTSPSTATGVPACSGAELVVEGASMQYPTASSPALVDASLRVAPGELVLVAGASGSGKSTLLDVITGVAPRATGGIRRGQVRLGQHVLDATHGAGSARIAAVFQDPEAQVLVGRVAEEVAFGLRHAGLPVATIERRVLSALDELAIRHLARRDCATLSGGELQRVLLAAALALEPALLVLDEPTSQVEAGSERRVWDAVDHARTTRGIGVLAAEHHRLPALAASYRELEPRLAAGSVWSVWHE